MNKTNEILDGLVEFLPNSNMNEHCLVISKAVEVMAAEILKRYKSPESILMHTFKDLDVNVRTTNIGHDISLRCREGNVRRYIDSLLKGLDLLISRVKDVYSDLILKVSVPKRMPVVERNILFDYLDSGFAGLKYLNVKYINADKVMISELNGVRIMAYT